MSNQQPKIDFTSKKLGNFPAKVVGCAIIDKGGKPTPQLTLTVEMPSGVEEAKYEGDISGDPIYAQYAAESFVTAGFKGRGWADVKKGVNSDTFDVVPFTALIEEVSGVNGKGETIKFLKAKYINSPKETKPFNGQVNSMEGTFMAAKAKLAKATPNNNPTW